MATTSLGLPLVDFDTDQPNGAGQMNALAEAVNALLTPAPVTVIPASGYTGVGWTVCRIGSMAFMFGHVNKNSGNFASTLTTVGSLPDASWAPLATFGVPIMAGGELALALLSIANGSTDIQIQAGIGTSETTMYCFVPPWRIS